MPVFAGIQTPRMSSERLDARCSLVERRLFGTRPHRTSSVLPRLFGPEWNLENLGGRVPGTLLGPEGSSRMRCISRTISSPNEPRMRPRGGPGVWDRPFLENCIVDASIK